MPKVKTKKAAAKRFKLTATGKVKFKRAGKRHNLDSKGPKAKLKLRSGGYMTKGDERHATRCLPYGRT